MYVDSQPTIFLHIKFAIILGEEELNNNQVAIKPLKGQGKQQAMRIEDAINYLKGQI
jgi:histidyl-tRNA synthetase